MTEAAMWYDSRKSGLGEELLEAVRTTLQAIRERPHSFPISQRDAHKARVSRFPYIVHFVVRADAVIVIAILHTSRDQARILRGRL